MKHLLLGSLLGCMLIGQVSCTEPTQEEAPKTVRFASYNIRRKGKEKKEERLWENRLPLVCALLSQMSPDVIGLQEPTMEQIKDLQQKLAHYDGIGQGRGSSWWGLGTDEATPIFYNTERFELITGDTFKINETGSWWMPWQAGQTGWLPRICTWVKLKDKQTDKMLYVYNTHLDHQYAQAQENGISAILTHIKEHATDAPVILMGDFNSTFEGNMKALLNEFGHVKELAEVTEGPHETRTGWDDQELKWIDHILVHPPEQTKVYTYTVIACDDYPSDHRPIFSDVQLP